MSEMIGKHRIVTSRLWMLAMLLACVCSLVSCSKQESAPAEKAATQKTFASPADAGTAFIEAAKSGDQGALLAIFGPEAKDVLFSGDAVKDKDTLQDFVAAYSQMNRWRQIKPGGEMLYVGADNFPFPIPLDKNAQGQWSFDTAAGKDEILARRIGKGELTAIQACGALANAQQQYFGQIHDGDKVKQYAQKFVSDPGQENGLYWPDTPGQPKSPVGPVAAQATADGYKADPAHRQPFHGYYFAMLTKQGPDAPGGAKDYIVNGKMTGGFAVVAYPAKYGDSGAMTFIVDRDGVVLQKDLGRSTDQVASAMTEFNPDKTWTVVAQ